MSKYIVDLHGWCTDDEKTSGPHCSGSQVSDVVSSVHSGSVWHHRDPWLVRSPMVELEPIP